MSALQNIDDEYLYIMYLINDDQREKPDEPVITKSGYKIMIRNIDMPSQQRKLREILQHFNKYVALNKWSQKEAADKLIQCCDSKFRRLLYEIEQKLPEKITCYDELKYYLAKFTKYCIEMKMQDVNKEHSTLVDEFMEKYTNNSASSDGRIDSENHDNITRLISINENLMERVEQLECRVRNMDWLNDNTGLISSVPIQ